MAWAKNQVIPNYDQIIGRLNSLNNLEPRPDEYKGIDLNEKQSLFRDIVVDWTKQWDLANEGYVTHPKPLKLVLMGNPGAGKSSAVRAAMSELHSVLGQQFKEVVRQATPTGCASFQMGPLATTVHKLFGLHVRSKRGDADENTIKFLTEKFKSGLALLLIDEGSMESRMMVGMILSRLHALKREDMISRMGFVLILDPAQLLPIAGVPFWSVALTRANGTDLSEDSIFGLTEFRKLFGMKNLEKVPGYSLWRRNVSGKTKTEAQRKQIAEFTLRALEGDYDTVYLTEINRRWEGDELSSELIGAYS